MSDFSNDISLDDLIAEANDRYRNFVVDGVEFLNAMQMSSKERHEFQTALQKFRVAVASTSREEDVDEEDVDVLEPVEVEEDFEAEVVQTMRDVLVAAAKDKARAKVLLDKVGDRMAVMNTLFTRYFKVTQVGEA